MIPNDVEEQSGIDDENYLVVCEEHVVDGVANFMARCILSNPKALVGDDQMFCTCLIYGMNFHLTLFWFPGIADFDTRGVAEE